MNELLPLLSHDILFTIEAACPYQLYVKALLKNRSQIIYDYPILKVSPENRMDIDQLTENYLGIILQITKDL